MPRGEVERHRSYAYDCAAWDVRRWRRAAQRGIVAGHPGFALLLPLPSARVLHAGHAARDVPPPACGPVVNFALESPEVAVEQLKHYRAQLQYDKQWRQTLLFAY